jgi:hypothetical protein
VWTGPLEGPFELVGSIDAATSISGVAAVDTGFVAAGTAGGQPALFTSEDGTAWTTNTLVGLDDGDSLVDLSAGAGVITIAGHGAVGSWAASSVDGGQTWQRQELDAGAVESLSVRGTSMSLLSTSALGTHLALSDGVTWSSVDLDIDSGARVELLVAGPETVLLSATEDGITWVVANR